MTDPDADRDPDEILQEAKAQKRHQSEPESQPTETATAPPLKEAIAVVYEELDAGAVPPNLTLRDRNLAALLRGLEETEQLDAVGDDLRTYLDHEAASGESRASVLGLLVRVGLIEVRPELIEAGEAGYERYLDRQDRQF